MRALIKAKANIEHRDRVRSGADVGYVLLLGSNHAMSAHVPNVSPFGLRMQDGETALLESAWNGKTDCLATLVHAKASLVR